MDCVISMLPLVISQQLYNKLIVLFSFSAFIDFVKGFDNFVIITIITTIISSSK